MAPPPVQVSNIGMASREAKMNPMIEYLLNWLNPSRGMANEAIDKEIRENELNRAIDADEHSRNQQMQLDAFLKHQEQFK